MSGFNLVSNVRGLNQAIRGSLAQVGGARSPGMTAMGRVLRKHMKRRTSKAGNGIPSAPGESPRKQKGDFSKSVKAGVVGTGIRVGPLRFTGLMLQEGVKATRGTAKRRKSGRRRGQLAGTVRRTLRIEARPYLLESVKDAEPEMAKAFGDLAGLSIKAGA